MDWADRVVTSRLKPDRNLGTHLLASETWNYVGDITVHNPGNLGTHLLASETRNYVGDFTVHNLSTQLRDK